MKEVTMNDEIREGTIETARTLCGSWDNETLIECAQRTKIMNSAVSIECLAIYNAELERRNLPTA